MPGAGQPVHLPGGRCSVPIPSGCASIRIHWGFPANFPAAWAIFPGAVGRSRSRSRSSKSLLLNSVNQAATVGIRAAFGGFKNQEILAVLEHPAQLRAT